jgi:hypothetical protein
MDAMAEMPPTSMPAFDPQPLLATLVRHEVRFVLIGALAATLHGSPIRTNDADITPDRSPGNLERLAAALVELDARVWTPDQPQGFAFDRSAEMLARSDIWNLMTRYGQLDISFTPSGTRGYPDLARHAVTVEVVRVARVLLQNPLGLFVGFEAGAVEVAIYFATAALCAGRLRGRWGFSLVARASATYLVAPVGLLT